MSVKLLDLKQKLDVVANNVNPNVVIPEGNPDKILSMAKELEEEAQELGIKLEFPRIFWCGCLGKDFDEFLDAYKNDKDKLDKLTQGYK